MSEAGERKRPAVFLDRDGVLNVYLPGDYVKSPAELTLLPGVGAAVRSLNDAGIPVFLISNQQGVAKGLMTEADLQVVDQALRDVLASDGATILQSYYCPHAKAAQCNCRKPQAGMLLQAAEEHGLDLATSVFVGDTETDAQAARAAGIGTFALVLSGKFKGNPSVANDVTRFPTPPELVADDLPSAIPMFLPALIERTHNP